MKLQIQTLARKQLVIEIDDTKTVYDLKRELAMYPDIGVQPELQKLIYNGKILNNNDELNKCDIDVKKFLVVMKLKQPEVVAAAAATQPATKTTTTTSDTEQQLKTTTTTAAESNNNNNNNNKTASKQDNNVTNSNVSSVTAASAGAAAATAAAATTTTTPPTHLVNQIVAMGYEEQEAIKALTASYNNVERAIEYLIEGLPSARPAAAAAAQQQLRNDDGDWIDIDDDDDENDDHHDDDPLHIMRRNPLFSALRDSLIQSPQLMEMVVQQIGNSNESLLQLISENRDEFLNVLLSEEFDDDDDEDSDADDDEMDE